jgi:hypothetical protein
MGQIYNIYGNLDVDGNSISNSVSASTITASTFFGAIDAKYIGTGSTFGEIPNVVNNTEFSYLSGLTGNVQTQINTKVPTNSPLIVYSASSLLSNERVISAGTNIVTSSSSTQFAISAVIGALEVGVISLTTGGDANYSLNNLNPNGWSEQYPNRATQIRINPTNVIKISGLSGGTSGRIAKITNVGDYLIILENNGNGSSSTNRFLLNYSRSYFLHPKQTITFIYDSTNGVWRMVDLTLNMGFSVFDDLYGIPGIQSVGADFPVPQTAPYSTNKFIITGTANANTATTISGSAGWRGDGNTGILRFFTNRVANVNGRIKVGCDIFSGGFQNQTGTSFSYVSKLYIGPNESFSPTSNTATIIGTDMNNCNLAYSATTSSNPLNPPNVGGGSFWLIDYSGNPTNVRYMVQNSGGTTTISSSTLTNTMVQSSNFVYLGLYSKAPSGGTQGNVTFFFNTGGTTEDNYVIHDRIYYSGNDVIGIPGNSFYTAYNADGASNTDNSALLRTDWIGMSLTDLT